VPAPGASALAALETGVYLMARRDTPQSTTRRWRGGLPIFLPARCVTAGAPLTEQYVLDLEREAFLSLCGERKTQERITFTHENWQAAEELIWPN